MIETLFLLHRLHQLEILGQRLVVEFSKEHEQRFIPTELKQLKVTNIKEEKTEIEGRQQSERQKKEESEKQKKLLAQQVNKMSDRFGMEYPLNPKLQYMCPSPTVTILTNIANALASVPKFYVQVLHLMNKMNLPPPFGAVTTTPPLAEEARHVEMKPEIQESDVVEEAEMEMSSEEESELESDDEGELKNKSDQLKPAAVKRTKRHGLDKPRKRAKLQLTQVTAKPKTAVQKVKEVFEVPEVGGTKKPEFKLTPAIGIPSHAMQGTGLAGQSTEATVSQGPDSLVGNENNEPTISWNIPSVPDMLTITEPQTQVQEGGFGKLEPVAKEAEKEEELEEEEEWGATEFISSRKLRRNRISQREMRDFSAFRNYQEGEPASRLYIKNVSRQVTEKDLHYVYGRYVDWNDETQKLVFDIRLMKEGRMKGQAFITLPDENRALEALKDTHGFMMKGKPIVVQFGRSAKPKEQPNKDVKEKKGKS